MSTTKKVQVSHNALTESQIQLMTGFGQEAFKEFKKKYLKRVKTTDGKYDPRAFYLAYQLYRKETDPEDLGLTLQEAKARRQEFDALRKTLRVAKLQEGTVVDTEVMDTLNETGVVLGSLIDLVSEILPFVIEGKDYADVYVSVDAALNALIGMVHAECIGEQERKSGYIRTLKQQISEQHAPYVESVLNGC